MKTEAELKKLAEFAAEFLGAKLVETPTDRRNFVFPSSMLIEGNSEIVNEDRLSAFIFSSFYSPILAHLGKREMEKRGFGWEAYTVWIMPAKLGYGYNFFDGAVEVNHDDYNEFITLWMAIEATGEK